MIKLLSTWILTPILLLSCTQKNKNSFAKDIQLNNEEIKITSFFEDKKNHNSPNTQTFRSDDNSILRIQSEVIELGEARKKIDQKSNEVKMMFAPQQVPYMGQITKDIKCTEAVEINNSVTENDKEVSLLLNLTATERLIYGSCIADQEIYKSQFLLLYCKSSKTFYEIKYFYNKSLKYKKQIANCL